MPDRLVSAICVTHSSRFGLLQRAIWDFRRQTYPAKELVIVASESGYCEAIASYIASTGPAEERQADVVNHSLIRVHHSPFRSTTEAFYAAAAVACGEVLACWDDDNLSHPSRLGLQLNRTPPLAYSTLKESLYYFLDSDELFVVDYSVDAKLPSERCAAASLMFDRKIFRPLDRVTASWAANLLDKLGETTSRHCSLAAGPDLFLVGHNGDSARGESFHRRLVAQDVGVWSREELKQFAGSIEAWLQYFCFPRRHVSVCGRDTQAFELDGVPVWPPYLATTQPPERWQDRLPTRAQQQLLQEERRQHRK